MTAKTTLMSMFLVSGSWYLASRLIFFLIVLKYPWREVPLLIGVAPVFLLHGILVISAWLFGWRAIILSAPGVFFGIASDLQFIGFGAYSLITFFIVVANPVVFALMTFAIGAADDLQGITMHWRFVFVGGIISSGFVSILPCFLLYSDLGIVEALILWALGVATNLTGLVVLAASAIALRRWSSHSDLRFLSDICLFFLNGKSDERAPQTTEARGPVHDQ